MPNDMTYGYDLILELSDTAVASLIPLPGSLRTSINETITLPTGVYPVRAIVEILPSALALEFLPASNQVRAVMGFDLNVSDHNLHNYFPDRPELDGDVTLTGLELRVTHDIRLYEADTGDRHLGMDFRHGFTPNAVEVDLGPQLGIAAPLVETIAADQVHRLLQDELRYLGSSAAIPLSPGDDDPWTLEYCTPIVVDEHCLALAFVTMPDRHGEWGYITQSHLNGCNAALLTSNRWLLQDLACPAIADYFNMTGDVDTLFTFSGSESRLNTPQPADHLLNQSLVGYIPEDELHGVDPGEALRTIRSLVDSITLKELELCVEQGYLSIAGQIVVEGTGMEAVVQFRARAAVHMTAQGSIEVVPNVGPLSVTISMKAWAIVLYTLAAMLSPIVLIASACLAPVVAALADRVVTAIAEALRGLEASLEGPIIYQLPPLPIRIERIVLDDLTYRGEVAETAPQLPPVPSVEILGTMEINEVAAGGSHTSSMGVGITIQRSTFLNTHAGLFRVETRGMRYPVVCRWSLDGAHLDGIGSVRIRRADVGYKVDGRFCTLSLQAGDSLSAELQVEVTDATGETATDYHWVEAHGKETVITASGVEFLQGPSFFEHMYRWNALQAIPRPIVDRPSWNAVIGDLNDALNIGMGTGFLPDMWEMPPVF